VINALMLMLTASLSSALYVEGFGAALLGSLVISIVSWFLGVFLNDDDKRRKDRD
jgi:putative membrane protein